MQNKFDSIAEASMAPAISQLGGRRCSSFDPQLPALYSDADETQLEGKPDFVINRGNGFVFLETKYGTLNTHRTRASSFNALKEAYLDIFHRCPDSLGLNYSQVSTALHGHSKRGELMVLTHGWNHSMFKLRAIQAKHGWQRFVVVFKKAPTKREATRYLSIGLVFCTIDTLKDMLSTIELLQHGWDVPFVFRNRSYSYSVTADPATKGMSFEQVEARERTNYISAVAADVEAERAQQELEAANFAKGIWPF